MDINERIRYLRKDILKLTQQNFSSEIDISRSNLGNIETGEVAVTERVIVSICRAFEVNEAWLKTGEGGDENIFVKATPYEKAFNRFGYIMENSSPSKKAALSMLLEVLYSVPDDKWEMIMDQFDEIKMEG